jgi:hypothetical protein
MVLVLGNPVADRIARSGVAEDNWFSDPVDEQALLKRIAMKIPLPTPSTFEDVLHWPHHYVGRNLGRGSNG